MFQQFLTPVGYSKGAPQVFTACRHPSSEAHVSEHGISEPIAHPGDPAANSDADLVSHAVGRQVRAIRTALGMSMSGFADKAGISLGMLSKIEHGQTSPSLGTLTRLAAAGEVPLTAIFRGLDEEHDVVIVRDGEAHEILHEGSGPGRVYHDLGSLRGSTRVIEPMMTTLTEARETFPLYQHEGVEFIHVFEGAMEYGYGASRHVLRQGDTMQIRGEVAHGPTSLMELPVRFLSVKVYPTQT